MQTNAMFEIATRNKLRFASSRGELSVEQLWDVPLRSRDGFDLNAVAQKANQTLKGLTEENFVSSERTPAVTKAEATLGLVKYVISVKLAEEEATKKRAANLLEKQKLLRVLAEKQDGKLSELSIEDLQKQIAALDA